MDRDGSPLQKELTRARGLGSRFGSACLKDDALAALVRTYGDRIGQTRAAMRESGVWAACARCAAGPTGSCCFPGMDESYGSLLLYANLLLGSSLPEGRGPAGGCRFNGENGCTLLARHAFCLNYFCPDLKMLLGKRRTEEIQKEIGRELLAGWELERALARWLSDAKK